MLTILTLCATVLAQDDALKAPCDQAAAHLAAGKAKDALAVLQPLLKTAAGPSKDRFHYYLGLAAFGENNDLLAGRALSRLAPFENPLYAAHARYLLGRVHHRAGEATEAAMNYDAVPAAFEKMPPAAKNPVPDFVGDALFHSAVLLYEQKAFSDALARFVLVLQKEKRPALLDEARLRAGLCQVRADQPAEAVKTLQPLLAHPKLARAARWWSARAAANPAEAVEHLKKALEAPEVVNGPDVPELQLALGDALERAGKPAEAVDVYKKLPPGEASLARLSGAHASAKQLKEAEAVAQRFEKEYPASPLLSGVLLRLADGAFLEAQAAPSPAAFEAVIQRYERVLSSPQGNVARYRTALALYRLDKIKEALAQLRQIPENERTGAVGDVALLLAECVMRSAPPAEHATDALQAAALLKDLQEAAAQFQKALPSAGERTPDVMLKLARALQQVATVMADPAEKTAAATAARELYEAFRAQFANHPLRAVAEYERANCYALAGDPNTGLSKLARFHAAPFADAPIAPLALLREAQLIRTAGNPQQAAAILAECRQKYEAALLKDPARAAWVPLIRYHHAAALKAANQSAQAVPILEALLKDAPTGEWAESAKRLLKEAKP
ncbi:MAG TPA: tetratricopeptide repeat protein [Planctomycetota bacterium]